MDTKLKRDIAEQAAVLHALKSGWGVLKPVGDRLSSDLVFDVQGTLIKIQVKYAWFDEPSGNYVVDNRRTKTNRRLMLRDAYKQSDFDFALVYIEKLELFYIFPWVSFSKCHILYHGYFMLKSCRSMEEAPPLSSLPPLLCFFRDCPIFWKSQIALPSIIFIRSGKVFVK